MKDTKAELKFKRKFYNTFPNYKIIHFTKLNKPIIFKDDNGFLHRKNDSYRLFSHPIGIESAINKIEYVNYLLKLVHKDLEVVDYKGMKKKSIIKDANGFTYSVQLYDILKGSYVSILTCNEKEDLFRFKANKKHNSFYEYPDFEYKTGKQKINIICPIHGLFNTTIESHIFGTGCRKCVINGFTKEKWIQKCKDKKPILYLLRFDNFIKIGITTKNLNIRFAKKKFNYETIISIEGNANFVFDLERSILKKFKNEKVIPELLNKNGKTECFNLKSEKNIYEYIKKKLSERSY